MLEVYKGNVPGSVTLKLSLRASWVERSELRKLGTASEVSDYAESLSATFAEVSYVAAKYVQKTRVAVSNRSRGYLVIGRCSPPRATISDRWGVVSVSDTLSSERYLTSMSNL